jgi:glyoxylase-like metal-dependent hydrolase (beta-lactamase superfamily II)
MCPIGGRLVGAPRWRDRGHLICHCLILETARDGLIVVDTGFGSADCAQPARLPWSFRAMVAPRLDPAATVLAQLAARGFAPRDVRHVVITHLDPDHAGGLPDFPWAEVHVHADERAAALARGDLRARSRYLANRLDHGVRWQTYAPDGDTWLGLPAVRPLRGVAAELALIPLVGHTRGHTGVAIRTDRGWLVHAGDAYFDRRELTDPGAVPRALRWIVAIDQVDGAARIASVAALRRLAARPDVAVICSHDPTELAATSR